MPAAGPLEVHCQQALEDIITISQRIRSSALMCANNQEDSQCINNIERLHQQLGTIRGCAETILEVITLQNRIVDEQIITWLFSGGLPPCLDKLKEMDDIFKLDGQLRPTPALALRPAADNITRAITLFEKHKDMFYFLLTPDVWDRERHLQQSSQPPQPDTHLTTEETPQDVQQATVGSSTEREHRHGENVSQSSADQEATRKKEFLHQKLVEVSRWLAALECTDKHNETLKQRQQGTCTWFPNTGAYKVWRSGRSPFLWLHGRGGCGKSVLIASIIEHLKSTLEDGDVLVYHYCDFRNERSTSPTEVMRSLLSQLFHHFRDCGVDAGVLPNRILEEKRDGTLMLNDLDQMAHLVLRAAGRFPREPIILIDALDECTEVEKFLPALSTLIHSHIRLLVTSRPLEVFKDHFRKYPSLSLHAMGKELAADIGLHITQELYSHAQLRSADAKLKRQVREKLHKKADGRFRWVQCQLDTLKRCSSRQELQDVLDNLPGELETTYERLLSKIDERTSEAKLVRRALVWLIAALVPLRLTQLLDGLSFDPRERRIHCGTRSLGPALLDALSSLVSYNKDTDVLALSHLTVKEYLTSRTALPMYRIIPHEAHIEVAEMCMFYVTSLLKQVRFRASLAISESSPMLSYTFTTGLNHLAHVDSASPLVLEVLQSFASEIHSHPSHWDLLCELREEDPRRFYPPWPSSRHDVVLYILIAYCSVGLLESFLSRSRPLKPRPGTNPLVYAADLWKTTHAITLLGSGVDVTVPGLVVDDSRHAMPLEVAVDLGNDVLVGKLLQRGSVVTSELLSTAVCMPWCSTRVLVQLVQTDTFTEWAHKIGDEDLYRAIFSSARPNAGDYRQTDRDHVTLARRLRGLGQDLAPNSSFGAELVERALHAAHISMLEFLLPPDEPPPARFLIAACTGNTPETVSVVRFLLDKKVNIRAVLRRRKHTALHLAVMSPWEPRALELTKMLLDAGCDAGVRNGRKETPLMIAVRRGYIMVVERLLSCKTSLPSHILLLALQTRQKPRMIQVLLRGGANIDACTDSGNTVLDLLLMSFEDAQEEEFQDEERVAGEVVREAWQDREDTTSQGDESEDDEIVDDSIEDDWSEYGDEDEEYESGIYGPCEEYQEVERLELVKILIDIETGCDPAFFSARWRTFLDVAMHRGDASVVEYLLSYGVPLPPDILSTALQHDLIDSLEIAALLVRKGADVHSTTDDGDTVLHLCIKQYGESSCLDLIKIFVEAGCDPNSYGAQGTTVLGVAAEYGCASVMEYLLSCNVPFPPSILSTALQHPPWTPQVVECLVLQGADMCFTTSEGDTAFDLAMRHYMPPTNLKVVSIFIKAGYNPTPFSPVGTKILATAIHWRYASLVDFLLPADARFPPDILSTALNHRWNAQLVEILVRKGADVHSPSDSGETIFHLAITGYIEPACLHLVEAFIGAGCIPTYCNFDGMSVLEVAIKAGYTYVAELLLSRNVPLPPHILLTALQLHTTPEMVEFLVRHGADVHTTAFNGDSLLQITQASYDEPDERQRIVEILENAREVKRKYTSPEDVTHVAKRPRLE
ncbi:ankyrin repeat-containing domain protein [Chiua virens]|nr:ankyrin repeat-containing domain protein [Chiua virens]